MRCRPALLRSWLAALALLLAAVQSGPAGAQPARAANILMLNSWHSGLPWHDEFERGIKAGLKKADIQAQIYVESLDVGRLPQAEVTRLFERYLAEKYAATRIDIVLAESLPARLFLYAHPELFPGASRIYAGTSAGPATGVTGIKDGALSISLEADFAGAVSEMVRVAQPRRIVVVGDTSDGPGRGRLEAFRAALSARHPALPLSELINLPMDTLLDRMTQLPEGSAVFYLLIFRDGAGRSFVPYESARLVAARSAAPVFSHWSTLMGSTTWWPMR
jgi:hypothetical protein